MNLAKLKVKITERLKKDYLCKCKEKIAKMDSRVNLFTGTSFDDEEKISNYTKLIQTTLALGNWKKDPSIFLKRQDHVFRNKVWT